MNHNDINLGRHIIDIDGCLRATDLSLVSARDIVALHGRLADDTMVAWEINGETKFLSEGDRVQLDQDNVAFFRTAPLPRMVRSALRGAGFPARGLTSAPLSLAA